MPGGERERGNGLQRIEARGAEALPGFIDLLEEAGKWLFERGIAQWPPGSNRALEPQLRAWLERGALLLIEPVARSQADAS